MEPKEVHYTESDEDVGLDNFSDDSIEFVTKDDLVKEVVGKTRITQKRDDFLLEVFNKPSPRGKSYSIISPQRSSEKGTWIYDSKEQKYWKLDTNTLKEDAGLNKTKTAQQRHETKAAKEAVSDNSSDESDGKKFDYGLEECDDSLLQEKQENEAWDTVRAKLDTLNEEKKKQIYEEYNNRYKEQRSMLINLFELGNKDRFLDNCNKEQANILHQIIQSISS